jgi:NAD(P)-dependent dehydrogenase (short-subunit alcohol dehydrogenase family)
MVVTGASSGIGTEVALAGAANGDDLVIVGRDRERLAAVARDAEQLGAAVEQVVADVADDGSAEAIVARALERFGSLDVLVPCAGVFSAGSIEELSLESFDELMRVNVRAPYALVRAAAPHLREGSSVVFVSSMCGSVGLPLAAAYCATKGAIEQLTRSLALEFSPRGVRINAIAPGIILTPLNEADIAGSPEYRQSLLDRIPAGRIASASEVAPVAMFLASDAASYMHGVSVPIDGGWMAR